MSTEAAMTAGAMPVSAEARKTFAVCFAALVATSFCFILRVFSVDAWGTEFALTETQKGVINGVGLWPFAISIVLLSLIIDRIVRTVRAWRETFEGLDVPRAECDRVATAFRRAADIGMREVERFL